MEPSFTAFGLVFLAELGDKSMLLALAFATRYRPLPVLAGIAIAAVTMLGLSALVGSALGSALPRQALSVGGGLLFLGFGVWMLRGEEDEEDDDTARLRGSSVLLGVSVAFLLAELGDKTMIATVALASTQPALPTWIGASSGMTAASGLAIVVGAALGSRLPERVTRILGAAAFVIFGLLLLADGLGA